MAVRLLVVDEHPVIRAGVRALLDTGEVEVVAEAADSDQAVALATQVSPDVILTGVRLPGVDGIETIARLRANGCQAPVLCFSSYPNPTYLARAMAMGAVGYLLKDATAEQLQQAILSAASGESCWTAKDRRKTQGPLSEERLQANLEVTLTRRESEVLKQLSFGLTNKEIAKALGLRYDTVKEHVQHVLRKLGVNDRTQAAVWAVRKGLV